jgi:hypothetical protein
MVSGFTDPGLSLRSNPALELANAFGVILRLAQTNLLLKAGRAREAEFILS